MGSEVIVKGRNGRPQVRYEGERYFGPDKRQKFLSALTLSCNVKSACAYAGVHFVTAYKVRRRDPEFAAQWREAIELGCERLEALILEHGGAGIPLDTDPASAEAAGAPDPAFDLDRALKALGGYRKAQSGERVRRHGGKPPLKLATREETNAALLAALSAFETRDAKTSGKKGR